MPHNNHEDGNAEEYKSKKHLLNFTKNLKKINFHKICEYADFHDWHWELCHGDLCCHQLRHAFYILVHKQEIIKKLSENPNFVPNTNYASLNKNTISREEALYLQNAVLQLNIKKYFDDIKFPRSLGYIGVAMFIIGEEIESENKKITHFLIDEIKKIIKSIKNRRLLRILESNQTIKNNINKLDEIYYNGFHLKCWDLEIFESIMIVLKNQKTI